MSDLSREVPIANRTWVSGVVASTRAALKLGRAKRIEMSFEKASPFVCLRNSQSALATWQAAHPEWHVERWRCAAKGSLPKDL